jgi:hypothetical protein
MMYRCPFIYVLILLIAGVFPANGKAQSGTNDTLLTYAVIYNGDTIEAKTLGGVWHHNRMNEAQRRRYAEWTRLRNAIYVTFPYAKRAAVVMNDVNANLAHISNKEERRKYIRSREKDLRTEFADPLMSLSVYQGKVLMKLINRETGNNCYEIIKEYRGGFLARFYQTVAFFFGSNLKQPYDKNGEEAEMEKIVLEVARMYGYSS